VVFEAGGFNHQILSSIAILFHIILVIYDIVNPVCIAFRFENQTN